MLGLQPHIALPSNVLYDCRKAANGILPQQSAENQQALPISSCLSQPSLSYVLGVSVVHHALLYGEFDIQL